MSLPYSRISGSLLRTRWLALFSTNPKHVLAYSPILNDSTEPTYCRNDNRSDSSSILSQMEITDIRASGLSTKACYAMVIEALQSSDWYTQNPAIRLVLTNGPGQAAELAEDQQVNLGRNVLQAGEGGARSARGFLERLAEDATSWPLGVVRGVALESFTNENNDIRPKDRRLGLVLSALSQLDDVQRDEIIAAVSASSRRWHTEGVGLQRGLWQRVRITELLHMGRAVGEKP